MSQDRARANSGKFYRLPFSVHLPVWVMQRVWEKLPSDCHLVACDRDIMTNTNQLVLWSEEFPARPEGQIIEELSLVITMPEQTISITRWNSEAGQHEEVTWQR